jgi:capsular polysaccharide biosynthesis protein
MAERDELDIDLGAFGRMLARSWWIILLLVIAGAVAGALIARFTATTYDASSGVYLGQPLNMLGNDIPSLQTNPRAAVDLATSTQVLEAAVEPAGEPWTLGKLRSATEVEIPSQVGRSSSQPVNFVVVHVRWGQAEPAANGATAVAQALAAELSGYAEQKIELLEARITEAEAEIEQLDRRATAAQAALAGIAASDGSADQKALAGAPYMTILQSVAQTRSTVSAELQNDRLSLVTANDIERPAVTNEASVPGQKTGMDWRVGAGIGVLVGFVIGLVVAVYRGRRPRPAAA